MNNTYIIFDETGDRYEVEEMENMTQEMPLEELEIIYKSTSYFKKFENYIHELYKKGELQSLPHGEVDFGAVDNAITIMGGRIQKEMGEDTLTSLKEEVEAQWEGRMNTPE